MIVALQVPDTADMSHWIETALTFTADNWNTPQTVTVTAHHDADAVDDDPVVLTHIVSGGDYENVAAADVEVTITEDDTTRGLRIGNGVDDYAEGDVTKLHRGAGHRASRGRDRRTTGARYRRHVALDRNRVDVHGRQLGYTADGNGHRTLTTPTLSMTSR